ncbi:MAG: ThuA domain-containing protein [Candidatus Omnitrophota bacterium]|jgi:type 1 glutamine amidotransferase|nr:MAG: ThuA domain-containing protein [Candidatus Omnitrophota bacterium]
MNVLRILLAIPFLFFGVATGRSDEPPLRVLIVTGQDYPGHKWRETTPIVRSILEQKDYFEVFVSEDVEILSTSLDNRYDVVVLHFCNWESPMPGSAAREGLQQFVASGKGLVALHFACGAFRKWPDYQELAWPEYEAIVGRVWDTTKTHDPYRQFEVRVVNREHPITKGLDHFLITDELYFCLVGSPKIDVLLTAHSTVTNQDEPMGFALSYQSGRVFHTPLGHDGISFRAPGFAPLLQRACEWAATGDVTRFKND